MERHRFAFLQLMGLLYGLSVLFILSGCQASPERIVDETGTEGWEKLGPGGGGSTFIPTFSYSSPERFLVRCDMTGSYLTRDGGDSYKQVNFENGASTYAYDPLDSNTIYVGSTFLNQSKDGGETWKRLFPAESDVKRAQYSGDHAGYKIEVSDSSLYNERYTNIGAIRADPIKSGSIYFSMGPLFFYTSDFGKTWKKEELDQSIHCLYTNPATAKEVVYIATSDALYIFDKSSHTIRKKDLPKQMSPAFSFTAGTLANSEKIIFYALHHDASKPIEEEFGFTEIWTSEDQGENWKRMEEPTITNATSGIRPSYSMISCAEFDAGKAYVVTNRYKERKDDKLIYWYGALKTNDIGQNWDWVWKGGGGSGQYGVKDGVGVMNLTDAWTEEAFGGEYIRLLDVGVYPANGDIAVVTDWYRTMKTIDGGKTWNQIYSNPQPDGTFISRGLDVTTNYGVHFDPFDKNHIAVSYTDIGYHHSFNGGKSWKRSVEGVPTEWVNTCYWMAFDPEVEGKVWSVWSSLHDFPRGKMTRNPKWKETGKGGVCVSLDGGKTWETRTEGMGFNSPTTSIVLDPKSPAGNRTLYASVYSKGVFKSIDDGKTWRLKNKGIGDNTCAFELTLADNGNLFLTVSPTPSHKDGKKGRVFYSGAVYKSTDGAETWTKLTITDGLLFPNGIAVDPNNPDRIYLANWSSISLSDLVGGDVTSTTGGNETLDMPGGIFLSENGGDSWISIFDDKQYVYDVTIDPNHPGRLYCNTFNQAAYRSDDYGKTWKKLKGYDFHWGQRAIIDQNDPEKIYLTTYGSSIWHGVPTVEEKGS